jgi:hypothetical protein
MSGLNPGWQLAAAWLLAVAVASVIYFVPATRLVDIQNPAAVTAIAD